MLHSKYQECNSFGESRHIFSTNFNDFFIVMFVHFLRHPPW